MEYDKCPICNSPATITRNRPKSESYIKCFRCGNYSISDLTFDLPNLSTQQIVNISGWIRENKDIIIDNEKLKSLMTLRTLSVSEKANNILKYLAKQFPVAGSHINYDFNKVGTILSVIKNQTFPESKNDPFFKMFNREGPKLLSLVSVGRIVNNNEFNYILDTYLSKEKGYISELFNKITPKGWAYLDSLRQPNPDSKKVFVAMWFTDEMNEICESYIKKAAEKAGGYKAAPINEKDYNGDINDEIIGEIRNSKFVIADFTGNRGGVYFEAGFAYGLNIPVIYTCREDWFNQFVKQSIKIKDSKGKVDDNELNIFLRFTLI